MKDGRGILSAIMSLILAIGLCPGLGYAKSDDRARELELKAGLTTSGETSSPELPEPIDQNLQAIASSIDDGSAKEQDALMADWNNASAYWSETESPLTAQETSDGYE